VSNGSSRSARAIGRPNIELSVEAGDWPTAATLQSLAECAISAAIDVLAGGESIARLSRIHAQEGAIISILFTNDAAIHHLNLQWRGKDRATNVLSFPQPFGPLLGDVILAAGTVHKEAALAGKPVEDHIAHLVVHGFLHLLGYDHQQDAEAEKMEELERVALKRLGIPDPYAHPQDP